MDRYFDRLGPWGAWMMRCTASLQVNLDVGPPESASARWRVANLLGPVLVASFANSAADLPDGTPAVSGRAWIWSRVDPDRTGARGGGRALSPRKAYLDFALRAPVMFDAQTRPVFQPDGRVPRFGEWWEGRTARREQTIEDWRVHLGTLFPDVRPRGWLEIRPVDVPQPAWWPVPAAFLSALLYDRRALREAEALLGALHATPDLSARALTHGLGDAMLRTAAAAAFELAEGAMARLPGGFFGNARRTTAAFRERFVEAGRTQADEARAAGEVARLRAVAPAGRATGASLPPRSS
jgi:glutamate--cysteine ligase